MFVFLKNDYKKVAYYAALLFLSTYWLGLAPSKYLSQVEIFIQERHNARPTPTSGGASDEHYVVSSDGRAIVIAWLKSEAPFRLVDGGKKRPGLYAPENWLVRLVHPGSWRRSGDWQRWLHFHNTIKVTEQSNSIEITFASYNPATSYDVINDILNGVRDYVWALSSDEDHLYHERAHFNAAYYRRLLSSYSGTDSVGLQALEQTILPGLYRRREHLLDRMRDAALTYAIREKNYGSGSSNAGNLDAEIEWIRKEINKTNEELIRQQGRVSHEAIRDAYLKSTLQEIISYDRPEFSVSSSLYMPLYKITLISKPSHFGQEYGPFRLRALAISLSIISVLYWIVKD
ncbi:hypothetical protein [Asaia sp. HN010]|uniref:hypothetical protein n=1 Tax=Asaia sp. HN010 TaxID=3081233 RepID=UPI003019FACC